MEDRYLFKAKRIDNGEWVEGYLVETRHNTYNDGYRIIDKDGINYDELDYYVPSFISYVIDKATICQCTGLKDTDGKLIRENDVVTGWFDGKRITGYIMYGSNATFFIERKGLYGIHLDNSEDWLEVIGNIFDEGSENIGKGAEEN